MLPEALSNELCSLKPDVDRLTKCVEFVLSKDGSVVSSKFYAAVIRSKRRFTYKEAFAVIQVPPTNETEQMLHDAHAMAQKIRHHRFKNGSLDLDFPENKIRLDEHGKVLRIERIENDVSHQLIEEYMLLANEAVAGRLMGLNRPSVYRIHESPKEKRLNDYREDVLSHRVPCGNLTHRPEVQKLLSKLGTLPIGPALKIGFLRSLMRARYAVEPLGHYGLAKTKYTHFTSPIRRYADLVVHRSLFDKVELAGGHREADRRSHQHHGKELFRCRTRQQGGEALRLPQGPDRLEKAAALCRARHRCAELRFLRRCARSRPQRRRAALCDSR
jgi:ribonuclease R